MNTPSRTEIALAGALACAGVAAMPNNAKAAAAPVVEVGAQPGAPIESLIRVLDVSGNGFVPDSAYESGYRVDGRTVYVKATPNGHLQAQIQLVPGSLYRGKRWRLKSKPVLDGQDRGRLSSLSSPRTGDNGQYLFDLVATDALGAVMEFPIVIELYDERGQTTQDIEVLKFVVTTEQPGRSVGTAGGFLVPDALRLGIEEQERQRRAMAGETRGRAFDVFEEEERRQDEKRREEEARAGVRRTGGHAEARVVAGSHDSVGFSAGLGVRVEQGANAGGLMGEYTYRKADETVNVAEGGQVDLRTDGHTVEAVGFYQRQLVKNWLRATLGLGFGVHHVPGLTLPGADLRLDPRTNFSVSPRIGVEVTIPGIGAAVGAGVTYRKFNGDGDETLFTVGPSIDF